MQKQWKNWIIEYQKFEIDSEGVHVTSFSTNEGTMKIIYLRVVAIIENYSLRSSADITNTKMK